ncbi:MAG: carboxypeptidase-like regulatory domain-containing protein [Planctomycetota bacterium]
MKRLIVWFGLGAVLLALLLRAFAPLRAEDGAGAAAIALDPRRESPDAASSRSSKQVNDVAVVGSRRALSEQGSNAPSQVGDRSTAPAERPQARSIAVVDAEGRALAADVCIFGDLLDAEPERMLRTDDAGRTEAVLVTGQHLVAFTPDGRCGVREVEDGSETVRVCAYGPVSLRGRIVDLDTDAPLPRAHVLARWLDAPDGALQQLGATGAREREFEVDSTGSFDLAPFRPGLYRLEFSCEGYETYVDQRPWLPTGAWDMGTVPLEALGDLDVRLLGFDRSWPPSVSFGIDGERLTVDAEGRATLRVPLMGEPQHFSIWLHDSTMMNVYHQGTLDEVSEVTVRVGGARKLRVRVEGEASPEVEAIGRQSLRVRYSPAPGIHAEWNRDLDAGEPYEADCVDAELASVDLLALVERWPNVISSTTVEVAATGVTEVVLQLPSVARRLTVLGADGGALPSDTFVELRRPHDATRWIASGHTDGLGRVFWPDVDAPNLYCSGVLTWGPPESFFIDLRLPNARGSGPLAPLALGPSVSHRVKVLMAEEALAGARVRVLGRYTDQPWTFYDTDAEGWTPSFLLSSGSEVDLLVEDPRALPTRVPLIGEESVITVIAR